MELRGAKKAAAASIPSEREHTLEKTVANINRAVVTGGLTRDPDVRETPGGRVARLRIAFSTRRRVEGQWQEKANYVDVDVWGAQAESVAKYLSKGRQVAIDGRLEWSEYEGRDGSKRQALRIVADNIQYLPGRGGAEKDAAPSGSADLEDHQHHRPDNELDGIPF
jgi:single-strand DNA-binding protein